VIGSVALVVSFTTIAQGDTPPNSQQVAFAQRTSNLMLATLFGALLQEFAETTPDNVEEGKKSISLIFNDANEAMRLVGCFSQYDRTTCLRISSSQLLWRKQCKDKPTTIPRRCGGSGITAVRFP